MEKLPEEQQYKLANAILKNNSMNAFRKAEIQLVGHFKRSTVSLVWQQFLPRWPPAPVDSSPLRKPSSRLLTYAPQPGHRPAIHTHNAWSTTSDEIHFVHVLS